MFDYQIIITPSCFNLTVDGFLDLCMTGDIDIIVDEISAEDAADEGWDEQECVDMLMCEALTGGDLGADDKFVIVEVNRETNAHRVLMTNI